MPIDTRGAREARVGALDGDLVPLREAGDSAFAMQVNARSTLSFAFEIVAWPLAVRDIA